MSDLIFDDVHKNFGEVPAVAGLDLRIAAGESVVLLGPSGCGKTTTLRMVAGFERPSRGSIALGGSVVADRAVFVPPEQRDVGVVFQSYALWPHLTVADNIGFGLTVRRRKAAGARKGLAARVAATLEQVQLDGLGDRYPHELSGGQQQRVALARALITDPKVLLLDEPLSNLDTRLREDMRLEIRRIQREFDITMIYITHDRIEALALADRIVGLKQGHVQQIGSPAELYQRPRNKFVALSLGQANFLPAVVTSSHGGTEARVRLGPGESVAVRGTETPPPEGKDVTVCVRPVDLTLTALEGPEGPWTGTVRESVFLGDEVHYVVDIPALGEPLRVVERAHQPLAHGTHVSFAVTPLAASVLEDAEGDTGRDTETPATSAALAATAAPRPDSAVSSR
ncbi:ABC transporter ATP-binding protein [Saccharomonospora sp. NPDC006951]